MTEFEPKIDFEALFKGEQEKALSGLRQALEAVGRMIDFRAIELIQADPNAFGKGTMEPEDIMVLGRIQGLIVSNIEMIQAMPTEKDKGVQPKDNFAGLGGPGGGGHPIPG